MSEHLSELKPPAVSSVRWLLPSAIGVALVCLVFFVLDRHSSSMPVYHAGDMEETHAIAEKSAAPIAMENLQVKLPDGVVLEARRGGVEDKLVTFLNDPQSKISKETWFDFDNLNFESASASITPESDVQVKNIVAILKAYPEVAIKIGGYTDKTGDSLANQVLSAARAASVVKALEADGAKAEQIQGSEGYGSQFAKAEKSDPDEMKRMDRRIAINVKNK